MEPRLQKSIRDYSQRYPSQFHLPGHNGKFIDPTYERLVNDCGVMKIDGSWMGINDDIPGFLKGGKYQDFGPLYHKQFNSKISLFTQNGSTLCNEALCLCLARKKVAIQVNSHVSVYNGLLLAGCEIVFVPPLYNEEFDLYLPVTADQIREMIAEQPDIGAFYLTSPSFEGLLINYEEVKKACGDRYLMMDEAHGAYCYYSDRMREGALMHGADASSISVHKTMAGISGTAMLQVSQNSQLPSSKVKTAYYLLNTTTSSPFLFSHSESCLIPHENNDLVAKVDAAIDLCTELL